MRHGSREFAHVRDDQFGAARMPVSGVLGSAMASSGKADRGHPGGNGGIDTRRAIFDYETATWRRPELLGGVEEEIGAQACRVRPWLR